MREVEEEGLHYENNAVLLLSRMINDSAFYEGESI